MKSFFIGPTILLLLVTTSCVPKKTVNSFIRYQVSKESTNMGSIEGKKEQNVLFGDYTTEVRAVAKDGYVFSCWSDGLRESARKDKADDLIFVTYYAFFEVAND